MKNKLTTFYNDHLKIKHKKVDPNNRNDVDDFKHAKKGIRKQVQKFGSFMAGMIMPTVGILIAWGLFAALFLSSKNDNGEWISKGWVHSDATASSIGTLIGPTMKYLIPTLIAFIAGKMIFDIRGGMMAAFVVFAAIIGNDWLYNPDVMGDTLKLNGELTSDVKAPNQIVAALMLAPLFAWMFKKIEGLYIHKVGAGFEMIVKNFGFAIAAMIFAAIVFFGWGFVMYGITYVMVAIINLFTKAKWAFPFMAIFTEPLRAMFLNNALNYGVMVPLGLQDIDINNKIASWYFMVGGNPGPGFGLLLAYVAWRKEQRAAAAGSSLIQLVGGIHEVHYVYILAEPIMILSTIAGAATSLAIVAIFGGGTTAVISPGSIISVIAMSPSARYIGINIAAVFAGAIVSFLVASLIMFFKRKSNKQTTMQTVSVTAEGVTFGDDAKVEVKETDTKTIKENANSGGWVGRPKDFDWKDVKQIMVACDAGMGSSAMAAGIIRKYAKQHNIDVDIQNTAVKDLTNKPDVIVTLTTFKEIAREHNDHAYIYPLKQFLGNGIYDDLFKEMEAGLPKKEEKTKAKK